MFARLSADTDAIRAYGSASSAHAADLEAAAARLSAVGTVPASIFGPVGAAFQAALARATEREARTVSDLSSALAAANPAAAIAAHAYEGADADAGSRLIGAW
ncbi:type VII secretion target [Mycolicibacterium pyrenivorans]|uniref:type VII secretion target n=1 Tax=Mycolicibacterium pyrenivorans TaxID=187102 RepID=UPI0021F39226|nr:type VII secretion target [Mycolicibacterium pyrenivorans]MCV7154601.1 ESX-1 secretion-associated protein [Mycolicibacterium pyrenivorans]